MKLTVVEKSLAARDTVRVRLAASDGAPLPAFKPGAHIELTLPGMTRRYSLSSLPGNLSHYEISVLRTPLSRGGSAYVHDTLAVGDVLTVEGPFNAFPCRLEASHTVIIAGGIGITPFFSMMDALAAAGRPYELHYAARDLERFLPVVGEGGTVRHYTDRDGRPTLDVDSILTEAPDGADIYVCGPRPLIEAVQTAAARHGIPEDRVHFESFGATVRPDDKPIQVHLAQSGMTLAVQPGTTILEALLENGVWAPYECRRGECASCVTTVLEGEPDHRDVCLTPQQRQGAICTCISWAKGESLTLDL